MQRPINIHFFSVSGMIWMPYAYGALRAYCDDIPELNDSVIWHQPHFIAEQHNDILSQLQQVDVACFSLYLWNEQYHNQLALKIKEKFPECVIIFGGPSVPNNIQAIQKNYNSDLLVHGEGEIPLSKILLSFVNGQNELSSIPNVTILNKKFGDLGFKNFVRIACDRMPSPYLKGIFDGFINSSNSEGHKLIALWEKDRGCPYSCTFCDWPWTGSRVRYRPIEEIFQEISYFSKMKIEDIYMCDANFGLWERDLDIARELVRMKKTTGYPKSLIFSSAKKSDERVREISKLLGEADMVWGTTLSVQSLNVDTLKAIKRVNLSESRFSELSNDSSYKEAGAYSEVIVGLPRETKESFLDGIGQIFERGNHQDLRIFELFVLPNAPIASEKSIKENGLDVRRKPLNLLSDRHFVQEYVDIVCATREMSFDDWVYCYFFGEAVQALHNGGLTRFFSIFLRKTKNVSYRQFYEDFLNHFLDRPETVVGDALNLLHKIILDFGERDDVPTVHKVIWNDEAKNYLKKFGPNRMGWFPYQLLWVSVVEQFDKFYEEIQKYLESKYGFCSNRDLDLINFQKSLVLRSDYSSDLGKLVEVKHNWIPFFFGSENLKEMNLRYRFQDKAMGPDFRYSLKGPLSSKDYALAAVGAAYPFSKLNHFLHQPSQASVLEL